MLVSSIIYTMSYDIGEYVDLTYLNEKPKKKDGFALHLENENDKSWFEIGTVIKFLPA